MECGGILSGICNRETGRCECYEDYHTSDGDGHIGKFYRSFHLLTVRYYLLLLYISVAIFLFSGNRGDCGFSHGLAVYYESDQKGPQLEISFTGDDFRR